MKKNLAIVVSILSLLAIVFIYSSSKVQASVNCPTGYICTPIIQSVSCPAGYICTPSQQVNTTTEIFRGVLVSKDQDYAGAWGNFGPGSGYANENKTDWGWRMDMSIASSSRKGIKSIKIISDNYGEGWSTSADTTYLGKMLYPLVVVELPNNQINNKYYDILPLSQSSYDGIKSYLLFGQKESMVWNGGRLIVDFVDGTQAITQILASSSTSTLPYSVGPVINNVTSMAAGDFEVDAGGKAYITGSDFIVNGIIDSSVRVYVGNRNSEVTQIGNDLIYFKVPSDLISGHFYDVYVVNQKGKSNVVRVKVLGSVSTSSSITVLYPNGGEILANNTVDGKDNIATIRWVSNNLPANATIDIGLTDRSGGKGSSNDIANGVPNTGSFTWPVNKNVLNGLYKIIVSVHGSPSVFDYTNAPFTIVSSSTTTPSPTPTPTPSPTSSPSSTYYYQSSSQSSSTSYDQSRINAVTQLYVSLLNRQPDQSGLNYFVGSSLTIDQIRTTIINSLEYKKLHPSVSTSNTSTTPTPTPSPSSSPASSIMMNNQESINASVWSAVRDFFDNL